MRFSLNHRLCALALVLSACGLGFRAYAIPRSADNNATGLSFTKRVAAQRAIEEVYWRYRIWPKENSKPKHAFNEAMSATDIVKKVDNYLRNSQVLSDQLHRLITPDQLQAEMDRMARDTKQPDVLRELFAALGNDPSLIAECLAKPSLAEQLIDEARTRWGNAQIEIFKNKARSGADSAKNQENRTASAEYSLPPISVPSTCDDTWTTTSATNSPVERRFHSGVWTGVEMIVWGGGGSEVINTGGSYRPSTDSWTSTSTINAPTARYLHTAIWTGREMIVWGGIDGTAGFGRTNTGGRYDPASDSWIPTNTLNAPTERDSATSIWTGNEVIVWGGGDINGYSNTGGRYNPDSDSWNATSTLNATGRTGHTAIWTGKDMIVWGGIDNDGNSTTGGRYNPQTNIWTQISPANVADIFPSVAIWTGGEMIVSGVAYSDELGFHLLGSRYNPITDSWIAISTTNIPVARSEYSLVWTGKEMILWGGHSPDNGVTFDYSGGRYNPVLDSWTTMSLTNAPGGRTWHAAVWDGKEMIVWGGYSSSGANYGDGGRYCVQPVTPTPQNATSRKPHGGVGSLDINLPLSGAPGIECRSGGNTNDYAIAITFSANVSVDGNPQAAITSGSGMIGSAGIPNGGKVIVSGNVVTVPLTNVNNAQTINIMLSGVNGSTNVTIPMSILIGDTNGDGSVNSADISQTKSQSGGAVTTGNARADVNFDGAINSADVSLVKSKSGTALP